MKKRIHSARVILSVLFVVLCYFSERGYAQALPGCVAGFDFSGATGYGPSIQIGATTAVPAGSLKRIPVKFHILPQLNAAGNPDPANEVTQNGIYNDLNLANTLFAGSGLQFYMFGDLNRINDPVLTNGNVSSEHFNTSPLNPHAVANVVNCFIVNRLDGPGAQNVAGGFAHLPFRGGDIILVTHTNMNAANADNTLAHELGHYFGLLHTFHDPFYQTPCELVNGANCNASGDYICDTPADPFDPGGHGGAGNGNLDAACNWNGNFVDANNQAYAPNTRNVMSYWNQNGCSDDLPNAHFSQQQKQSMWARANRTAADNWGRSYLQIPCEANPIVVNHAISGNTILKSTGDITITGNLDITREVIVSSGTAIRINGANVRIRIAAGGNHRFVVTPCVAANPVVAPGVAEAETITGLPTLLHESGESVVFRVNPNPALGSGSITVNIENKDAFSGVIKITGANGILVVQRKTGHLQPGRHQVLFNLFDMGIKGGIYFITLKTEKGLKTIKLMLQ